jgi:hypothetical protein
MNRIRTLVVAAAVVAGLSMPPAIAMGWPRGHPERGPVVPPATPAAGTWTPPPRTKTAHCSYAFLPRQDAACTPGSLDPAVTQATIWQTICVAGWTARVRNVPQAEKDAAMRSYGVDPRHHPPLEIDHLVSLELGGDNSIANLWPEPALPKPGFREKDVVESFLRRQVCLGRLSLNGAQREIATDWTTVGTGP